MRPVILNTIPRGTRERIGFRAFEAKLREMGEVIDCPDGAAMAEEEYQQLWRQCDGALTGWGVWPPSEATAQLSQRLRIVAHAAGSVRMLPRRLLEEGVVVTTTRSVMARTVAEWCLGSAIHMLRRFTFLGAGGFDVPAWAPMDGGRPANGTLFGKRVGLVGYGCVAHFFREMLRPFGCEVVVFDPFLAADVAAGEAVRPASLDELLNSCDVVSLHAPDIPDTRGMIGARELALLRDGALLLNSARGRLIDTEALTAALTGGRFFAALDVTAPEPLPPDHPLRTMPNVLLTPHVAGPTTDELPRMAEMAIDELRRFFAGDPVLHGLTLTDYDRMSF